MTWMYELLTHKFVCYICACVYMYIVYVLIYIVCIQMHMYAYMCVCDTVCVHIYIYIYIYICKCVCVCVCACIYIYIYIYTHTRIFTTCIFTNYPKMIQILLLRVLAACMNGMNARSTCRMSLPVWICPLQYSFEYLRLHFHACATLYGM
jgi:hypothetical protein